MPRERLGPDYFGGLTDWRQADSILTGKCSSIALRFQNMRQRVGSLSPADWSVESQSNPQIYIGRTHRYDHAMHSTEICNFHASALLTQKLIRRSGLDESLECADGRLVPELPLRGSLTCQAGRELTRAGVSLRLK